MPCRQPLSALLRCSTSWLLPCSLPSWQCTKRSTCSWDPQHFFQLSAALDCCWALGALALEPSPPAAQTLCWRRYWICMQPQCMPCCVQKWLKKCTASLPATLRAPKPWPAGCQRSLRQQMHCLPNQVSLPACTARPCTGEAAHEDPLHVPNVTDHPPCARHTVPCRRCFYPQA